MSKMNIGRVIAGGLVAGLIINIAEGVTNGAILGQQWKNWAAKMATVTQPPTSAQAMILWTILAFAVGLIGIWMYAAIRTRFGPGPKTAMIAGLVLWILYWPLVTVQHSALGTVPLNMEIIGDIGGLVGAMLGVLAGAAVYKE
jgi:hypothetical protein